MVRCYEAYMLTAYEIILYCHILRVRTIPTLESTDSMIDVGVVINDNHSHLRGEWGGGGIHQIAPR